MPDLDTRLARSRAALLAEIEQPPLADVRRRAARIRRRRATRVGAAALAVVAAVGIASHPWADPPASDPPAAAPTGAAPVYKGEGIEITGLAPGRLFDIEGEPVDVEFTDAKTGMAYAIPGVARTDDGGLTWTALPPPAGATTDMELVAFPGGRYLLAGAGPTVYVIDEGGARWRAAQVSAPVARAALGAGEIPRLDRTTGAVTVWNPDRGPLGPLAEQPDLTARWIAPAPAADGAWWVGGVGDGGAPAVAVTRDGGRSWQTRSLDVPSGQVSTVAVGTLGTDVYAVAKGKSDELRGIYYSADGGRGFAMTYSATAAAVEAWRAPAHIAGDPVPLLDGRLLLAGSIGVNAGWWLSDDDGATLRHAAGLPFVGPILRTIGGYVAYRLFGGPWSAFSTDGTAWQKLQFS